jgi:hypothetical protein
MVDMRTVFADRDAGAGLGCTRDDFSEKSALFHDSLGKSKRFGKLGKIFSVAAFRIQNYS